MRLALGWVFSIAALVLLLSRMDWGNVKYAFYQAELEAIFLSILLVVVGYLIFSARFLLVLRINGNAPYSDVFWISSIGHMTNSLFPLRTGDPLRAMLLRNSCGIPIFRGLASIVIEKALDVVTLLIFSILIMIVVDIPRPIVQGFLIVIAAFVVIIFALGWAAQRKAWVIVHLSNLALRLGLKPYFNRRKMYHFLNIIDIVGAVAAGKGQLLFSAFMVSILAWLTYCAGMAACLSAFQIPQPWLPGIFLVVVTNLGSAIPSSPGSIGIYHALAIVALSPWNVPFDTALSIGLLTHLVTIGVQVLLGLLGTLYYRRPATE